jgi:hypothetical protein
LSNIVKCVQHASEAVGVCVYCGRALCPACIPAPDARRLVCSAECAQGLARTDDALQTILQRSAQNARASAFYCYLCAGLSAGAAVAAWYMLPSPFLIYFTGACALVLFTAGIWYGRSAPKAKE